MSEITNSDIYDDLRSEVVGGTLTKVRARCGKTARRDLCGGRGATRVPTATERLAAPRGESRGKLSARCTVSVKWSALGNDSPPRLSVIGLAYDG